MNFNVFYYILSFFFLYNEQKIWTEWLFKSVHEYNEVKDSISFQNKILSGICHFNNIFFKVLKLSKDSLKISYEFKELKYLWILETNK